MQTLTIELTDNQPINTIHVGDKIFDTIYHIEENPLAFRECEEFTTKIKESFKSNKL